METSFKRMSTYGKILGIVFMVYGVLSALSGIMFFGVGAIPGIITVWLGYLIFQSGKDAEFYLQEPTVESKDRIIVGYSKFLMVSGIMAIVSIALGILSFGAIMFIVAMTT